jgi:hypothetical protein
MKNPFQGKLTNEEWQELVAIEYVLTWRYSENPDRDEKRLIELREKKGRITPCQINQKQRKII